MIAAACLLGLSLNHIPLPSLEQQVNTRLPFVENPTYQQVGLVVALLFLLLTVAAARAYPEDTDSGDS